jgi:energy-converting hydrogenase Eha subunit E
VIQEGQSSFRSQVSYVNLVAVLVITALIIVGWNSQLAALVFAAIGVAWTGITLRSSIDVSDEGFTVRGLLRTRRLSWGDIDAFVVVGLASEPIATEDEATRVPMLSVVAALTSAGALLRVPGTASTPIDPDFPRHAAAELNRRLRLQSPVATAAAAGAAAPALSRG